MDSLNGIVGDLKEFVQFFIVKYKYDQRGILKRMKLKSGLNKQLNEDVWCKSFIQKTAYNYCAKFLIIKYLEDNMKIPAKINSRGLEKWKNLVSCIDDYYNTILDIAQRDVSRLEEVKHIFKESDYDIYEIDNELAEFIIKKLEKYDFDSYDFLVINQIFNMLYNDERKIGLNLQYFYKPAKAIDYIMSIKETQMNLV